MSLWLIVLSVNLAKYNCYIIKKWKNCIMHMKSFEETKKYQVCVSSYCCCLWMAQPKMPPFDESYSLSVYLSVCTWSWGIHLLYWSSSVTIPGNNGNRCHRLSWWTKVVNLWYSSGSDSYLNRWCYFSMWMPFQEGVFTYHCEYETQAFYYHLKRHI